MVKDENRKKAKIIFVKDRPGHDYRYLNSKKIMNRLNWRPIKKFKTL